MSESVVAPPFSACLGVVELWTGQSCPAPVPEPMARECWCVQEWWLNRARPGMLHPWGGDSGDEHTRRGNCWQWFYSCSQSNISGLAPAWTRAHPSSGSPCPSVMLGVKGSAGFHPCLQAGTCSAWPFWDPGLENPVLKSLCALPRG